jgi:hypothetical protein
MPLPMSGFDPYMPTDTVDETASYTDMQGPSSSINQLAGKATWSSSPTKSLIGLWLLALGLYWLIGWLFKGQRS